MKMIFENWKRYLEEGANLDYDRYAFVIEKTVFRGYNLILFDVNVLEKIMIGTYKREWKWALKNGIDWKDSMDRTNFLNSLSYEIRDRLEECIKGVIAIEKVLRDYGPCYREKGKTPYDIGMSAAIDKLGPMIYDFALQMVKFKGGAGLMADRSSVSKSASSVWQRYLDSGRGATGIEVKSARLDYEPTDNTTDTKKDDCEIIGTGHKRSEKDLELGVNHIFYVDNVSSEFNSMGLRGQQITKELKKKMVINIDGKDIKFPSIDLKPVLGSLGSFFFNKHYKGGALYPK